MTGDKVYLVGAGPGDPELLTVKAVRVLAEAEVVLVDDLVNPSIIEFACSTGVQVIHVGKRCGAQSTPQGFINRKIIQLVRQHKRVVRLKGGDPFIFGRGGEEMIALNQAGICVEIVPGITAATGIAAALGLPVTCRGWCTGVTLVTGHTHNGSDPNWKALVESETTLVVYMGLSSLPKIAEQLVQAGMNPVTPVVIVKDGTLETEQRFFLTLDTLLKKDGFIRSGGPSIIIIGPVVALAQARATGHLEAECVA
ncbi:MAG: uroporphyrinogen-III C-methyltransferase [Proteobacteria bacterium]|nr:uroporphyrinogen-III C-methyltransferase [Pseudomonadota bacterium]MDE3208539.1 uroporphyrinogen-III C-methyltransferase [Pseudomonadota bacterium]